MSENPFATPLPTDPQQEPVQGLDVAVKPPGALTTIAVICLILGILGLMGSCGGGVGFAMQGFGFAEQILDAVPAGPDREFQKINLQAAQSSMIPTMIIVVLSLVVATMLIIGSIGCLRRKETGRSFLRTALLAGIVYCILKLIVTAVSQTMLISNLRAGIENHEGDADKAQMETLFELTMYFGIAGAVIGGIIALAIAGFYFWSRGYLNREDVISYFATAPQKY